MKYKVKDFYNISKEDEDLINEHILNKHTVNGKVHRTYTGLANALKYYLENNTTRNLLEWEQSDLELFFLWTEWKRPQIKNMVCILRPIFLNNKTQVVPPSFIDDITEKIIPDEYYKSFKQFEISVCNEIDMRIAEIGNIKRATDMFASLRAVYYLIWLGLDLDEIKNLKKSDCNTEQGIISIASGARIIHYNQYQIIYDFFKEYKYSDGYSIIRDYRPIYYPYYDNGMFIRTKKAGVCNISALISGKRVDPYMTYDKISWSGKFERLFFYEQYGGDINDIVKIAEILDIKGDIKKIKKRIEDEGFIKRYNIYKQCRISLN